MTQTEIIEDTVIFTIYRFFSKGKKFAIGDCAFEGNSNVVAGLKRPRNKAEKLFDQISRSEQVVVEHVNAWIKNASVGQKHKIQELARQIGAKCIYCLWYV